MRVYIIEKAPAKGSRSLYETIFCRFVLFVRAQSADSRRLRALCFRPALRQGRIRLPTISRQTRSPLALPFWGGCHAPRSLAVDPKHKMRVTGEATLLSRTAFRKKSGRPPLPSLRQWRNATFPNDASRLGKASFGGRLRRHFIGPPLWVVQSILCAEDGRKEVVEDADEPAKHAVMVAAAPSAGACSLLRLI